MYAGERKPVNEIRRVSFLYRVFPDLLVVNLS